MSDPLPSPPALPAGDLPSRSVAETERLRLRQVTETDLPPLVELLGNLEVMRYSMTGPLVPLQVAQVLEMILESYAASPLTTWAVIERSTQCMIGLCGFLRSQHAEEPEWELAYRILPAFWGRGLATEAAIACCNLAFQQPQVTHIVGLVEPANRASIRVMEKAGLEFCASIQRQNLPALRYVLKRPEWLQTTLS